MFWQAQALIWRNRHVADTDYDRFLHTKSFPNANRAVVSIKRGRQQFIIKDFKGWQVLKVAEYYYFTTRVIVRLLVVAIMSDLASRVWLAGV